MIAFTVRGKTFIAIFYSIFDTNEEVKLFQALTVDELREMINLLTPSVNRPEVKGYTYCHTFCGHELTLRIVASVRKGDISTTYKMVQSCCAFGCTNRSGEGKKLQFYSFLNIQ